MHYYEVAPSRIIRADSDSLTYASTTPYAIGQIVEIEVGKQLLQGVIVRTAQKPTYATKEIIRSIEDTPLPQAVVSTALWMSQYYATPLATVLQTILPRGLTKKRRSKDFAPLSSIRNRTNFVLNKDQLAAIESLKKMSPGTALLHGVTGSGKTRVYIELARETLARNESVIVLVPEIALTSQLVEEFAREFGEVLVAHSRQTESERHQVWRSALTSPTPRVAIGPRSALFLPLPNLGLIVIDECHEPSYKQEQSPRYSALTTASVIAKQAGAKLILGSATPLIADRYLAEKSDRPIISLPSPAHPNNQPPDIHLVDMTKRASFSKHRFLSDKLLQSIQASLEANQQVLLFHNRRGSAPTTLCENCGWQAGCPRCFVPLTLHGDHHALVCHICNTNMRVPTSCPECQSVDIIHKGIGTKLIESEIRRLYPNAIIARFDGDTDSTETVEKRYQQLYDGTIDIIIGTQVIAKGLDLPKLRTVGVVQADAGLSLPDYTSPERTFQLLAQVIGRVGRFDHPTEVIIQSYQPNHPSVVDGIAQNYQEFYERSLALRQHAHFPPFSFLLKLTCVYKTEATAVRNAKQLAETLRRIDPTIEILGPAPAFYERVRDTYRWQLTIKSSKRANLVALIAQLPPKNWQFELDPLSLL